LHWLVDGLPAAEMKVDTKSNQVFYDMGFELGNDDEERFSAPALNNHYEIVMRFVCLCLHKPIPN
jgi:transmembrane 9 superfamily protein 2/4